MLSLVSFPSSFFDLRPGDYTPSEVVFGSSVLLSVVRVVVSMYGNKHLVFVFHTSFAQSVFSHKVLHLKKSM